MIDSHEFSSQWYGSPVGIVRDAAFFALPAAERREALQRYSWVEYRAAAADGDTDATSWGRRLPAVRRADPFPLEARGSSAQPQPGCLTVVRADQEPFAIGAGDMAEFTHERFSLVPGITTRMITQRYDVGGGDIEERPAFLPGVTFGAGRGGWFLSSKDPHRAGLNLALAVLHRESRISGMLLYRKALGVYRTMGESIGWASFSATNTPVLNIYSELGARFASSSVIWLWINPDLEPD